MSTLALVRTSVCISKESSIYFLPSSICSNQNWANLDKNGGFLQQPKTNKIEIVILKRIQFDTLFMILIKSELCNLSGCRSLCCLVICQILEFGKNLFKSMQKNSLTSEQQKRCFEYKWASKNDEIMNTAPLNPPISPSKLKKS